MDIDLLILIWLAGTDLRANGSSKAPSLISLLGMICIPFIYSHLLIRIESHCHLKFKSLLSICHCDLPDLWKWLNHTVFKSQWLLTNIFNIRNNSPAELTRFFLNQLQLISSYIDLARLHPASSQICMVKHTCFNVSRTGFIIRHRDLKVYRSHVRYTILFHQEISHSFSMWEHTFFFLLIVRNLRINDF